MDTVEVGGLRVAYERAGAGPPLVLAELSPEEFTGTLLVYGDQGVRAPLPVARALQAAVPGSTGRSGPSSRTGGADRATIAPSCTRVSTELGRRLRQGGGGAETCGG